ncbi:tetratricopeptide repeat-containing glycosyltransferase family protein [Paraburkholderia sp.]|uniref:tetratricopeptide repeat-containing glycosyltransferase family protein n=1 Tax=Paraburkholderia sp. TaxID=1926495 RepID=UPI002D64F9DC|nr:tetratricopeptide repeat-containing glycosyltransferase family protein [Paraburkholderia sp.]HZZ02961.1 tetratricopeptide repeat-containing glycosyltransferase family protein [Paraburkholderia sp.]
MLPTSDSETPASSAFLTFLRRAAAARQNGTAEAEAKWLDAAAQRHPLDDESIESLITTLLEQHRHNDAIELAAIIAQLDPHRALAHFRFGYTLQMANRHSEAIAPYRRALAIDPKLPQLRNNLAGALVLTGGDLNEQLALLESAVHDAPHNGDAWTNLTQASRVNLNLPRALEAGAKAVQCAPHSPLAHNNYALALREAQRWDEAEHAERTACALAPNDATMRANLSMLHLMRGDYAHGWQTHEARWDGSLELGGNRPAMPAPTWRGEPLAGKTLLVWGEQGMGDVLQFSRYIPMLAERVHREGGRLVWNSFPQMGALLARSLGNHVDDYSAGGGVESLPPFDYEIPLLSLPLIFDTREETIPAANPYLRADAASSASWQQRLASETRLKVGLTWTGSLNHQRNPFRRVGWERYAEHFGGMHNVAFYSLQPGAEADVAMARASGLPMSDYTAEFTTFDDTAAFVSALDLVITVCTSAAHLSGALGRRTWVLLDVNPHWVWLLDRSDSPWHPSATLYRQPQFGQWDPVLEAVTHDLSALAARHHAA